MKVTESSKDIAGVHAVTSDLAVEYDVTMSSRQHCV